MPYCTFTAQKNQGIFCNYQRKILNRHALVAQHLKLIVKAIYLKQTGYDALSFFLKSLY